jgi:hypothetical protein
VPLINEIYELYEKSNASEIYDGELKIVFEHDILEDGE